MASDKRELLLIVRGKDMGAKAALDGVAEGAEDAKDGLDDMNVGLKKLDHQIATSTKKVEGLRREIAKSGDLGLVKDLEKAQRELNRLTKQRKLIIPVELDVDKDLDMRGVGADSARGFALGFSQKVGPLLARAPISPHMALAFAGAAPAVASVVSGAVTAGVALASVGAGLKIAFTDPAVQAAGKELGKELGDDLKDAAKPFSPAVIRETDRIRAAWRKDLKPELEGIFEDSARYVRPLSQAAIDFSRELAPGIRQANKNAEPLVDTISFHIPRFAASASSVLKDLSAASDHTANRVSGSLASAEASLAGIGKAIRLLAFIDKWAGAGGPKIVSGLIDPNEIPNAKWIDPINQYGDAVAGVGTKAEGAKEELRDFYTVVREGTDRNLDARQAARDFEQAIDDATTTIKENGKTLDINTQKGRDNQAALDAIRREAFAAAEGVRTMGGSQQQANTVLERGRIAFINAAVAAGTAKEAAIELANQLFGLPKNVGGTINYNDKPARDAISRVVQAGGKIKDIKRGIYYTPYGLKVPGGTLTKSMGGYIDGPGTSTSDSIPARLSKGEYVVRASAVDRVGVKASDDINAGRSAGQRMMSAAAAMAGAARGYGGGPVEVRLRWVGPGGSDEGIGRALARYIRAEVAGPGSGSVQRAFG